MSAGWYIAAAVIGCPLAVYVLVRFGSSAYFRSRADYFHRLKLLNRRKTNGSDAR